MSLNVKLLRRIKKHILEKPRRFLMGTFWKRGSPGTTFIADDLVHEVKFESCGTAACIGGWAVLLTEGINAYAPNVRSRAVELLGLPKEGGFPEDRLFEVTEWPLQFRDAYMSAKSQGKRARVAAARIDHFIATKGAE